LTTYVPTCKITGKKESVFLALFFQKSPVSSTPPQVPSSPAKSSSKATTSGSDIAEAVEAAAAEAIADREEPENVPDDAEPAKREVTPDLISSSPAKEATPVKEVAAEVVAEVAAEVEAIKEKTPEQVMLALFAL
jgi:hypothetical protein